MHLVQASSNLASNVQFCHSKSAWGQFLAWTNFGLQSEASLATCACRMMVTLIEVDERRFFFFFFF